VDVTPGPVAEPVRRPGPSSPTSAVSDRRELQRGRPSFAVPLRTVLAMLAVAGMTAVLALGALSGTFGPALP
jgi:hypothetical protein